MRVVLLRILSLRMKSKLEMYTKIKILETELRNLAEDWNVVQTEI